MLDHIPARSFLAGDTANVWEDIDIRIDQDFLYIMSYLFHEQKG